MCVHACLSVHAHIRGSEYLWRCAYVSMFLCARTCLCAYVFVRMRVSNSSDTCLLGLLPYSLAVRTHDRDLTIVKAK